MFVSIHKASGAQIKLAAKIKGKVSLAKEDFFDLREDMILDNVIGLLIYEKPRAIGTPPLKTAKVIRSPSLLRCLCAEFKGKAKFPKNIFYNNVILFHKAPATLKDTQARIERAMRDAGPLWRKQGKPKDNLFPSLGLHADDNPMFFVERKLVNSWQQVCISLDVDHRTGFPCLYLDEAID